jgi:hypothetical protein
MASGTYGTGLDSDVATTRIVYNTGDKYQFKIDAGWIRVESPYGVLPGAAGPLPMQRRQGDDTTGNGRDLLDFGPTAGITGNLFSQAGMGEQPEAPVAYPPLSEPEGISASGVGDVYLAFSRRFVGGGAKVFRMDGGVEVKAPIADADEGLGTGEWDTRVGLSSEYRKARVFIAGEGPASVHKVRNLSRNSMVRLRTLQKTPLWDGTDSTREPVRTVEILDRKRIKPVFLNLMI